jgi:hypothetical protein
VEGVRGWVIVCGGEGEGGVAHECVCLRLCAMLGFNTYCRWDSHTMAALRARKGLHARGHVIITKHGAVGRCG